MKMQQLCTIAMLAALVLIVETQAACDEEDMDAESGKRQIVPSVVIDDIISTVNEAMKRNLQKYWRDSEATSRRRMPRAVYPS